MFDNAAQSMIPAVVSHDSQQLERANGQLGAAMMVTQEMAGPAVGGAVFAVAAAVPFAADAVSFGASSALIASIRGSFKPLRELPPGEGAACAQRSVKGCAGWPAIGCCAPWP